MICPSKEICLAEKRILKRKISKYTKETTPKNLSDRLKKIDARLMEIEEIQGKTDPAKGGLHFTENAIRGD